jgi:hypothetical protein
METMHTHTHDMHAAECESAAMAAPAESSSGFDPSYQGAGDGAADDMEFKAARRHAAIDGGTGTVSVYLAGLDAPMAVYTLAGMPRPAADHLAALGLWACLSRSENMDATYARLKAGDVPKPRTKELKLPAWRMAIALALVDATKKAPEPLTLDAAKAKAAELPRETVAAYKLDPAVIKHYHKLQGTAPAGVAALVAAVS